jgi:very-short-patch-repair endonuclease
MPRHTPLPDELIQRPMTFDAARWLGASQSRLRSSDIHRPFHGVVTSNPTADTIFARCRQFAPLLTAGRFFSHTTAALLWGCPLPLIMEAPLMPLHVTTIRPGTPTRAKGVIGHSCAQDALTVMYRYGFPVSDPCSTWLAMSAVLAVGDLVAVGDHLIHAPAIPALGEVRPYCTLTELKARTALFRGRGAERAAAAVDKVRPGAESRTESHLRLLIVGARLPEPRVNPNIYDRQGTFIARVDLAYPEWMTIVEYDGGQHRTDTAQYERDILRIEALERAGWTVVRVRASGLYGDRVGTIARVVAALTENGWSPSRSGHVPAPRLRK